MPLSRIYVQGDSLKWEDSVGNYSTVGAIPNPMPSGFSGQVPGRIWVTTTDNFLYYSDSTGQTRFVKGVYRGTGTTGSVYAVSHVCPTSNAPAKDLFWVNGSGFAYSARSQGTTEPKLSTVVVFALINPGTLDGNIYAYLSSPISTEISITGISVLSYADNTCGGGVVGGASGGDLNVTVPAGQVSGVSNTFNLGVGASYRVSSGSVFVNLVSRVNGEQFCLGEDQVTLQFDDGTFGVCINVGGGDGNRLCGEVCVPGSSDPNLRCLSTTGCICNPNATQYNSGTKQWEHVCYNPNGGGGGGVCVCDPFENICSPSCPAAGSPCGSSLDCETIQPS